MQRLMIASALLVGIFMIEESRERLDQMTEQGPKYHELLYLPNGKYLRIASLGQAPLLADLMYLWAIQYYSDYGRGERFRFVEHVFGDVIGELDPHYVDPYWIGAMILSAEAGDIEAGLRLLDKGFERNPEAWVLPYLAAWDCYRAKDFVRAASYLEKAARVPGAPQQVLRMRAAMFAKAGDLRESLQLWREILDDPESDGGVRAIAERQARDLRVRVDLADLEKAVGVFRERTGRLPSRLGDLVRGGLIAGEPVDPNGERYLFDRATGRVSSPAARILGAH